MYSCDLSRRRRRRDRKNSVVTGHVESMDNCDSSENSEEEGPHSASLGGSLAAVLSHSAGERGSCDTDIDASMQLLLHRAVSESDEKKLSLFTRSRRKVSCITGVWIDIFSSKNQCLVITPLTEGKIPSLCLTNFSNLAPLQQLVQMSWD